MTDKRIAEIELLLLRAAVSGPLDGRQQLAVLGLEVIAGIRSAKEMEASANERSHTRMLWHNVSWTLLKEACELLERPTAVIGGGAWMEEAKRFLRKVKDNA
jgi:hypothetical protein